NQGRADNEPSSDGPFNSSDGDPNGINENIGWDGPVDWAGADSVGWRSERRASSPPRASPFVPVSDGYYSAAQSRRRPALPAPGTLPAAGPAGADAAPGPGVGPGIGLRGPSAAPRLPRRGCGTRGVWHGLGSPSKP